MPAIVQVQPGHAENKRGHKPLGAYDLPSWVHHPLRPSPRRTAVLFPGEQNQYIGMCGTCADRPAVRQLLQSASTRFGFDVEELMQKGPEERQQRVDNGQLLTFVANCAAFQVLKEDSPEAAKPSCVAGWSVGLYAALVAAEVLTYDEGLLLAKARADALQRWSAGCSMQALGVSGLDVSDLALLCHDAIERDIVDGVDNPEVGISHVWGRPDGAVCSGLTSTVQQLEKLLDGYEDAMVQVLEQTRVALHTPLAKVLVHDIEEALRAVTLKPPKCSIYFNSGQMVAAGEHPDILYQGIVAELTNPLRWDSIVMHSLTTGVVRFVECGPGQSLADLMPFNEYADVRRTLKPAEFTESLKV